MEKFDSFSSKKFKLAFRVPNNCEVLHKKSLNTAHYLGCVWSTDIPNSDGNRL